MLTNGEEYQFFTDLDAPNKMDSKPFLVLDLNDIDATLLPELRKLCKENFDLGSVLNAAEDLKYVGQIKRALASEFKEPTPEWVRFFTSRVYDGSFTQKARDQFTPLVFQAAQQFLTEQVNDRLTTALGAQTYVAPTDSVSQTTSDEHAEETSPHSDIVTTVDELEGFHIVRAIVCKVLPLERVTYRDAKSYFAIFVDDNNRQPVARLHFNTSQKYIGLFDEQKTETRFPLNHLSEIYDHSSALREAASRYA